MKWQENISAHRVTALKMLKYNFDEFCIYLVYTDHFGRHINNAGPEDLGEYSYLRLFNKGSVLRNTDAGLRVARFHQLLYTARWTS